MKYTSFDLQETQETEAFVWGGTEFENHLLLMQIIRMANCHALKSQVFRFRSQSKYHSSQRRSLVVLTIHCYFQIWDLYLRLDLTILASLELMISKQEMFIVLSSCMDSRSNLQMQWKQDKGYSSRVKSQYLLGARWFSSQLGRQSVCSITQLKKQGQCGHQDNDCYPEPERVQSITHNINEFVLFTEISCGMNHTAALTSTDTHLHTLAVTQSAYMFGSSEEGQLGLGPSIKMIDLPVRLPTETKIKQVTCGDKFSVFLTSDGEMFTSGNMGFRQTDIPTEVIYLLLTAQIKLNKDMVVKEVYARANIMFLTMKDQLYLIEKGGELCLISSRNPKHLSMKQKSVLIRDHDDTIKEMQFEGKQLKPRRFEQLPIVGGKQIYSGQNFTIVLRGEDAQSLQDRLSSRIGKRMQYSSSKKRLIKKEQPWACDSNTVQTSQSKCSTQSQTTLGSDQQSQPRIRLTLKGKSQLKWCDENSQSVQQLNEKSINIINSGNTTLSEIKSVNSSQNQGRTHDRFQSCDQENFSMLKKKNKDLERKLQEQQLMLKTYQEELQSLKSHAHRCPLFDFSQLQENQAEELTFTFARESRFRQYD